MLTCTKFQRNLFFQPLFFSWRSLHTLFSLYLSWSQTHSFWCMHTHSHHRLSFFLLLTLSFSYSHSLTHTLTLLSAAEGFQMGMEMTAIVSNRCGSKKEVFKQMDFNLSEILKVEPRFSLVWKKSSQLIFQCGQSCGFQFIHSNFAHYLAYCSLPDVSVD